MSKETDQELFNVYFTAEPEVLDYFGAKNTAYWDYCIDQVDDEWAVCGDSVVWGPGENPDGTQIPLSSEECTYSSPISEGVFRGEHFTMVFMRLHMGGSDAATIFDNSKEQTTAPV